MAGELEQLLNQGLAKGYAGESEIEEGEYGPFTFEISEPELPRGHYRDQFMADNHGVGMEVVELDGQKRGRVYGGGTASHELLRELGITERDVTKQLKRFIRNADGQTRLGDGYSTESDDGEWEYDYHIEDIVPTVSLSTGLETIRYRGTLVFAHAFIHTPID